MPARLLLVILLRHGFELAALCSWRAKAIPWQVSKLDFGFQLPNSPTEVRGDLILNCSRRNTVFRTK